MKTKYTFKRWFAHLLAYNLVAINYNAWKFKYLFHDIDKPFMGLFFKDDFIKKYHRTHSKHHMEYHKPHNIDYIAMVIDWECSGLTKKQNQLNAWETLHTHYDYVSNIHKTFTKDAIAILGFPHINNNH